MLNYLLPDEFSAEVKKANFESVHRFSTQEL